VGWADAYEPMGQVDADAQVPLLVTKAFPLHAEQTTQESS